MSADLFGRPLEPVTVQGELALPGEDVIDRQPILLASDLPMDPLTVPLDLTPNTPEGEELRA